MEIHRVEDGVVRVRREGIRYRNEERVGGAALLGEPGRADRISEVVKEVVAALLEAAPDRPGLKNDRDGVLREGAARIGVSDAEVVLERDVRAGAVTAGVPAAHAPHDVAIGDDRVVLKGVGPGAHHGERQGRPVGATEPPAVGQVAAIVADSCVVPRSPARDRRRHAMAVSKDDVVLEVHVGHRTQLELLPLVRIRDRAGDRDGAPGRVQQVEAVLGVVIEVAVIAGEVEQRGGRRAHAISVRPAPVGFAVLLVVANTDRDLAHDWIFLGAAAVLDDEVRRVDLGRGVGQGGAVVEVPPAASVGVKPHVIGVDGAANRAGDAGREAVDVEVNQVDVCGRAVGVDAVVRIVAPTRKHLGADVADPDA